MYVVKPMVGRGDRHCLCSSSHRLDLKAFLEIAHEISYASAGGRHVSPHFDILFWTRPPLTGRHPEFSPFCLDEKHGFGRVAVEFTVKPQNEFSRGRWRQCAVVTHA